MACLLAFAACGDDGESSQKFDAPVVSGIDAKPIDAPSGGDVDGGVDAKPSSDAQDQTSAVIVAVGDIAGFWSEDDDTAALVDEIDPEVVLLLGDLAYYSGSSFEYGTFFEPSWGRHKAILRPSPGNHDHRSNELGGYCDYFGEAAHCQDGFSYYSFDVGAWHIIALDSGSGSDDDPTADGSPMREWLAADLAANTKLCTLAYFHHPRFSSGQHGNAPRLDGLWQALYDGGVDVVLNGHEHNYERFAAQDPSGSADENGIVEVVVGTGGIGLRAIEATMPNSLVREDETHGVLKMTLNATSYDLAFVPIDGQTFTDQASGNCH